MIQKTIYIRYISNYGWTYLIISDDIEAFNNESKNCDIWYLGGFVIEIEDGDDTYIRKELYKQLETIRDKVFTDQCFLFIPKQQCEPNPTIKDSTEPRSGYDLHPTISLDNYGNPPII